jgi:hypothetical protein
LSPSGVCTQGGGEERLDQLLENQEKLLTGFGSGSGLYGCSGGPEWLRYIIARAQGCALGLQNVGSTSCSSRQNTTAGILLGSWLYSYFCYLAPTILRPERGELSFPLIGPRGRPPANQKILRQRGVEGGCRRAASNPQKCKLWFYIVSLN